MRTAFALLAVVALLPLAAAQDSDTPLTHLSVQTVVLDSGETFTKRVETGEGPWEKGMVFVLNVFFGDGPRELGAELVYGAEEERVNVWELFDVDATKGYAQGSTVIPYDDGPYTIKITNGGNATSRFGFFFDQSCQCTLKPIAVDHGMVVFRYDLTKGHQYNLAIPLLPDWRAKAELATTGSQIGDLEDFKVVKREEAQGPEWLNVTWTPGANQRYYLFVTALSGARLDQTMDITVLIEDKGGRSPGPSLGLALLGVLALVLRRR